MKKILLIHNTYRNLGGEDIAVASEVEILKKHYDVKEIYFSNLDTNHTKLLMLLLFNRNRRSEDVVRKAIIEYSPDLIYIHNTWFNISLGIFKMIQGLIALERGVISTGTRIGCDRSIIGCHGPHSNDNLEEAIVHSCNPYFHEVMRRMIQPRKMSNVFEEARQELSSWTRSIQQFGLGTDLGGNFSRLHQ